MKTFKTIFAFSVLAAAIFWFCGSANSSSEEVGARSAPPAGIKKEISAKTFEQNKFLKTLATDEVKVGTYLLNIRKLDVGSGMWVVDFYVWFIWHGEAINPAGFEIMNGACDFKDAPIYDTIEIEGKPYKWLAHRIIATMSNNLNFKSYPLDLQYLTIEIEDRENDIRKMKYRIVPDENNIDEQTKIQGWEIKEKFNRITTHTYNTSFGYEDGNDAGLVYSRYVFGITISRPRFSSILKLILPLSIILSLSFLSFALSPDKVSQRISLGISTVFTSVAFHINLTSAIPQVSYLTLADRLMISTYFMLFTSLISTIYLIRFVDNNQMEKAVMLNKRLGILIPLLGISVILLQFAF